MQQLMATKEQHIGAAFDQEQARLTGFVRKQVGSQEDAEDIVQEVFMSLAGGFDDISDLRKTISWIYSVAKNKVVDFLRKKKTYALEDQKVTAGDEDETLYLSDLIPSLGVQPDDQMMQDLIWDEIRMSLEELPEEQRKVFEWHELEGFSFQQISESTGVAVNTLISRKRYAVLYLREQLGELFKQIKE